MKRRYLEAMSGVAVGALAAVLIPTAPAYAVPPPDPVPDLQELATADQAAITSLLSGDSALLASAQAAETADINAAFADLSANNLGGALFEFDLANETAINTFATVSFDNNVVLGDLAAAFPSSFFDVFQPG